MCVCVGVYLQAYGVGGMRKRQELPAIEDRDKPYVCDSERDVFYNVVSASFYFCSLSLSSLFIIQCFALTFVRKQTLFNNLLALKIAKTK